MKVKISLVSEITFLKPGPGTDITTGATSTGLRLAGYFK